MISIILFDTRVVQVYAGTEVAESLTHNLQSFNLKSPSDTRKVELERLIMAMPSPFAPYLRILCSRSETIKLEKILNDVARALSITI